MSGLSSFLALVGLAVDRARRDRLLWFAVGGAVVIAAVVLIVAGTVAERVSGDDFVGMVIYGVAFQTGAPLVLTYLGVAAIHDELADRSAVHLFVRPVPRWRVFAARWVAVTMVGAAAVIGVAALMFGAGAVRDLPWRFGLAPDPALLGSFAKAALLAAPAYVAVGMLCGAVFRRPLIAAIAYVVASELIASNLPPHTGVRHLTVADPVRRFVFLDFAPADGSGLARMLTMTLRRFDPAELAPPTTTLAWITGIALVLGLWIYTRREYDSRPRD